MATRTHSRKTPISHSSHLISQKGKEKVCRTRKRDGYSTPPPGPKPMPFVRFPDLQSPHKNARQSSPQLWNPPSDKRLETC